MSGGQRQRLAIARSIIKKPPILILDEATSSIDVRTERIVQAALDRVSQNRTTIVIAHRLSTIKKADKIVVLRHGKLVEEGTHEQLLRNEDGVYYGLVRAQELTMEHEEEIEDDLALRKTRTTATDQSVAVKDDGGKPSSTEEEPGYKQRGLVGSFGLLLYEQRSHRFLWGLTILGALGGGGKSNSLFLQSLAHKWQPFILCKRTSSQTSSKCSHTRAKSWSAREISGLECSALRL